MPIQRFATFLVVAITSPSTRETVAHAVGQSTASTYRHLMALTEGTYRQNRRAYTGLGWLTCRPDAHESRRWVWELSPKGRRILTQLEEAIVA